MNKVSINYDGEYINISPIKISTAAEILGRPGIRKMYTTLGIEILPIDPAKIDEDDCTLGIHTNGNHALAFHLMNAFFIEIFPSFESRG